MTLPPDFVATIRNAFGPQGEDWLHGFPALLADICRRWDLTVERVLRLSYNFVAAVRRADGTAAVLKLGVPDRELTSGCTALRIWNGRGAVRLLESDPGQGCLLLEKLVPGTPLSELADDEQATVIAAEVMLALWQPAPENSDVIPLASWFRGLTGLRARRGGCDPLPERLIAAAESLLPELISGQPQVLLHGDLHHTNILRQGANWLAIDPKGVTGPRGYEVGPFLINPVLGFLRRPEARAQTERRLSIFSERLGLESELLRNWAIAFSALSATWDLDEGGDKWRYAAECGEMFLSL